MANERGWLREEFDDFFGHAKDEPEGVKDWTISTLGPTKVGKTVLISGLYAQYHLGTEHGKAIGIEFVGAELHDMLGDIAKGLRARPIKVPPPTKEVRNAKLKFLVKPKTQAYQKIVHLQDHAGEHFPRSHPGHQEMIEHLQASDSFMVLLESEQVLRDDYAEAAEDMELSLIKSLIRDISDGLYENDIIPIAVAFSKADTAAGREEDLVSRGRKLFESISEELPQCVFCFSPVSVIRNAKAEETPYFIYSPNNIEVPFLFCLASVVIRNAAILKIEAEHAKRQSKEVASTSLAGLGFFKRIVALIGKSIETRRLGLKSKRYVSLSVYDLKLAESALDIIKLNENVTFMRDGVVYNDVDDVVDLI